MILIAVICTNSYDYKTFIAGFQFAEGVNIQFKAVVTPHDAQGQNFAGYYLTPAAARRPDAEDLVALLDSRLRKVEAVLYDHGERAYIESADGCKSWLPERKEIDRRPNHPISKK